MIDYTIKSCCGGSGHIRWSDANKRWQCTDCGDSKSNDPFYYWTYKGSVSTPTWVTNKKCECGGDTAKTTHARYCPKYE